MPKSKVIALANHSTGPVTLYTPAFVMNWEDFPQLSTFRPSDLVGPAVAFLPVFDSKELMDSFLPEGLKQGNYYSPVTVSREAYEAFRRHPNMIITKEGVAIQIERGI